MEKFLRTKIKRHPDYNYEVYYGGCVMMVAKSAMGGNERQVIYWFDFDKGKEMRDSWELFEYFIDEEGDISKKSKVEL